MSWFRENPALRDALFQLGDQEVADYEEDIDALAEHLATYLPELEVYQQLCHLDPAPFTNHPWPKGFESGIKRRKWQQIYRFASAVPTMSGGVVDWCAGKGHLSRVLTELGHGPLEAIERESSLCAAGRELAKGQQLPVRFHQLDVLHTDTAAVLKQAQHAVALHACGSLHVSLIEQAVCQPLRTLTIAPCCYHLDEAPRQLSNLGQQARLSPTRDQLRMAVQDQTTAPNTVKRRRRQLNRMRLGFDLLQRELRGTDEYLTTPPLPNTWAERPFDEFCHHLAKARGVEIPSETDLAPYLNRGTQREHQLVRLELLRHLFRRPLELWWIMDRALYLQQHGYSVDLKTFCGRQHSPRNVVILAQLSGDER